MRERVVGTSLVEFGGEKVDRVFRLEVENEFPWSSVEIWETSRERTKLWQTIGKAGDYTISRRKASSCSETPAT